MNGTTMGLLLNDDLRAEIRDTCGIKAPGFEAPKSRRTIRNTNGEIAFVPDKYTKMHNTILRPMLLVHTKDKNKKYFGSAHEGFVPHALVVVRQFLSVSPLLHIYVYENFHCSCVVDLFRIRKCL